MCPQWNSTKSLNCRFLLRFETANFVVLNCNPKLIVFTKKEREKFTYKIATPNSNPNIEKLKYSLCHHRFIVERRSQNADGVHRIQRHSMIRNMQMSCIFLNTIRIPSLKRDENVGKSNVCVVVVVLNPSVSCILSINLLKKQTWLRSTLFMKNEPEAKHSFHIKKN